MDQEEETSIGGSSHSNKSLVASDLASASKTTSTTATNEKDNDNDNDNDNNIVSPNDSASRFEMTSQTAPQQPHRSISATNSSRSTDTSGSSGSSGSYSLDQFACDGDDQYVNQNSMVLEDLGYGDAAPDVAKYHNKSNLKQQQPPMLVPRRSSLKGSSSGTSPNQQPRRGVGRAASMGCGASTMMEVRIRGERFPVQRRRSIVFASEVEIQEVEPVSSLVDSFSELWLTADDFVEMKQNRRHVVKQHKLRGQKAKYAAAAAANANAKSPPPDSSPPPSSSDDTIKKNAPRSPLPPAPPLTESANSQHSAQSESSEELDEENYSLRGLEKYMDKSIRLQKNMAWDAVLLEQDEQELAGHYNPYRIADLYKHTTYQSPEKAVERAQQDQADIQEYLMSPRTKKLMMRRLSC